MKENKSALRPSKQRIVLISLVAILAAIFISYAIPLSLGDGTEKYSGAEKNAAMEALKSVENDFHGNDRIGRIGYISFRVEAVRPVSVEEGKSLCGSYKKLSDDPSKHYAVTVSYRTWFGFTAKETVISWCEIL